MECGGLSAFIPGLGYSSARGYQYNVPQTGGTQSRQEKFSLWNFLGEVAMGGLIGGFTGAAFYGAGKGIEKLGEGGRSNKSSIFSAGDATFMDSDDKFAKWIQD